MDHLICARPELTEANDRLTAAWNDLRAAQSEGERKALLDGQRQWMKQYAAECGVAGKGKPDAAAGERAAPCVQQAIEKRVAALEALKSDLVAAYAQSDTVQTTAGLLDVRRRYDDNASLVLLDGHTLARSDETVYGIADLLPSQPPHRYVLLLAGNGGNACDGPYVLFDAVPGDGRLTAPFGGCGIAKLAENGGALEVIFTAPDPVEEDVWRYSGGTPVQIKKGKPPLAQWLVEGNPVAKDGRSAELSLYDKFEVFQGKFAAVFEVTDPAGKVWRHTAKAQGAQASAAWPGDFKAPFAAGRYRYRTLVKGRIVDKGEFDLR